MPSEDLVFLADRKNAPYGTKEKDEILRLCSSCITRLANTGAERVLIACCTASSVHGELDFELQKISVPIIAPVAEAAARVTKTGNIAVIATAHTARSGAFKSALLRLGNFSVSEQCAQELVEISEKCASGAYLEKCEIKAVISAVDSALSAGADTLILGCTHFSFLYKQIKSAYSGINIIDSAKVGALHFSRFEGGGKGNTFFI